MISITTGELEQLAEDYAKVDPLRDLELVIRGMVAEQELRNIARAQSPIQKLIYNDDYVRGVLGISIPLNESYPYSPALQERILQEQLQLEGFFQDFKDVTGTMKNFALALRYVMEEPSRVKELVSTIYETVIKDPLTKITDFIKRVMGGMKGVFEKFALPKIESTWEKIKEFLAGVGDKLQSAWDKLQGMSGWKQALAVLAFGAGIGYLWHESGIADIVGKAGEVIDGITKAVDKWGKKLAGVIKKNKGKLNLAKAAAKGGSSKNESLIYAASLSTLLYEDEALNELLGLSKKDVVKKIMELDPDADKDELLSLNKSSLKRMLKDEKKKAGEEKDGATGTAASAEEKYEKGKEKAEKAAEKLTEEELGWITEAKNDIMEKITPLIDVLKEKVVGIFKGVIKQLGVEAIMGLVSGGVGTFISAVQKAFGGAKLIAKLFGDSLGGFVSKMKNPEEEAKEAEAGEDDPTDDSTKKEEKKEALFRDDQLLRAYVREAIMAA